MNSKIEHSKAAPAGEIARYVVAALLVIGGLVAYWYLADRMAGALRGLLVAVGLIAGTVVFLTSGKGRETRGFLSEARFELRKVVWPTRQEAVRTTIVVIIVVTIMSLLLAGFDYVISIAIKSFLNFGR